MIPRKVKQLLPMTSQGFQKVKHRLLMLTTHKNHVKFADFLIDFILYIPNQIFHDGAFKYETKKKYNINVHLRSSASDSLSFYIRSKLFSFFVW